MACSLKSFPAWLMAATLAMLAGCGKPPDASLPAAAKVGTLEIPAQQVDQMLARAGLENANPQMAQAVRREVLDKLIDQHLAAEQALRNKLDAQPEVLAQMELARREVLSRAYLKSVASAAAKPSADDMRKYYAEHPELFGERRIFNLQEIIVTSGASPELLAQVRAELHDGKSLVDLANWLQAHQVKFSRGAAIRAAEQIPLELLGRVHALKDGQLTVIAARQGFTILKVASSEAAPLAEAAALPRIEQFLTNQRSLAAVRQQLQQLRSKAGVSYLGDFARSTPEAAASAPATSATGTPAEAGK